MTSAASDKEKIDACDDLAAIAKGDNATSAVPELVPLLSRRGPVGEHALKALKAIHSDQVIDELIRRLSAPGRRSAPAAADALVAMPDRAELTVLGMDHLFHDGKPDEKELVCSVLEGLGPAVSDALPWLLAELRTRDTPVRGPVIAAARALAPGEPPSVFSYIADLHREINDAREAADGLNKLGSSMALALPDLLNASEIQDPYLHTSVTRALARITQTPPACVPGLIDLAIGKLMDGRPPENAIRLKAIQSLAAMRPTAHAAIEMLVELLPDDEVGDAAAQTLIELRFGDESVVKRIGTMLARSLPVRRRAAIAIRGAGPFATAALEALKGALVDDDLAVRRDSSVAIAGIGSSAKSAVPQLESVLRRGDDSSTAAATALGGIGPSAIAAVPVLLEAIRAEPVSRPTESEWDISAKIRSSCAAALVRVDPNSQATRDLLLEAVRQKDWVVREALTGAMIESQNRDQVVPALQSLTTDHDELVRINARCALRELKGASASQPTTP